MNSAFRLLLLFLAAMIPGPDVLAQGPARDGAWLTFSDTVHDFGTLGADTPATYRFEFVNTGSALLIINEVRISCPCFEVNWIRGPVMPQARGWVDVRYPATGKPGPFNKMLWIVSNAVNNPPNMDSYELRIKGKVAKSRHRAARSKHTRGKSSSARQHKQLNDNTNRRP